MKNLAPQGDYLAASPLYVGGNYAIETSPGASGPGHDTLCLDRSRSSVEVAWRDFEGNTGVGDTTALPSP